MCSDFIFVVYLTVITVLSTLIAWHLLKCLACGEGRQGSLQFVINEWSTNKFTLSVINIPIKTVWEEDVKGSIHPTDPMWLC